MIQGSFLQSGGMNTTVSVAVAMGSLFKISGGTLKLTGGEDNAGVFDGGGGSATISANCMLDMSKGTWQNLGHTTLNMGSSSLLIVPAGINPSTFFGSYTSLGITHTAGTTLVVPAGKGFIGAGAINDPVSCQGTITDSGIIAAGGAAYLNLSLNNGLVLSAPATSTWVNSAT